MASVVKSEEEYNTRRNFPNLEDCIYTFCYCEENIWKLCEKLKENEELLKNAFAVFVSNERRIIPLWCQKAGEEGDGLVTWDYHVFLIYADCVRVDVYDFDSTLGFPTPFNVYIMKGIHLDDNIMSEYHRMFRVIKAEQFLKTFSSDRRHMKRLDGTWVKEPPPYDPIQCQGCSHNIDEFISMKRNEGVGNVMNLNEFIQFFTNFNPNQVPL